MTRPERRWEVNGPRTGRSTPARASSAAPPSTEVEQEAIAAAPPASSPRGLKRKYGVASAPSSLAVKNKRLPSAAAPPIMPTRAAAEKIEVRKEKKTAPTPAVEKCIRCTVGNEKSCLACLRTCAETAAGISNGQKEPEMDHMFLGVAVDGSNEEDVEGDHLPPLNIWSNVSRSSARSTGSSPNEKSRSPEEVTSSMDKNMKELLDNIQKKWDARQKALQDKDEEVERMVTQVLQMARECGVAENNPDHWLALLEIIHSERATKFFMGSDPFGRMTIIECYAMLRDMQGKSLPKKYVCHEEDEDEEEDEEEEWGHNENLARMERYTVDTRDQALLVKARVDDEVEVVLVFRGFSSSLSGGTAADPSRSVLPERAIIQSVDVVKGPFDPNNIEYLEKGVQWDDFKSRL